MATIASCRSSKIAPVVPNSSLPATTAEQWASISSSYSEWTDVKIPVKLELESPANAQVSGTMVMERGKSIYMSYKLLGFEVLNMQITPDSIFATYKPSKLYVAEPLAQLTGSFPMTMDDLQDMMLGRAFAIGGEMKDATIVESSAGTYAALMPPVRGIGYAFTVNDGQIKALTIEPQGTQPVICLYDADVSTVAGPVSPRLAIAVPSGQNVYAGSLTYNLGKASWNSGEKRQWRCPKGYKKVLLANLFKSL